jgi:hypothetical protein
LPLAPAQEAAPGPAKELQQLAPLIGNWAGNGVANFGPGAPPTKWQGRGTFRWCLDRHFVQEDFEITFEGVPVPMVFRSYLGWDREQERFVNLTVHNGGEVKLHDLTVLPDGTLLQLMRLHQNRTPYAERSLLKASGDTMTHSIDMLMHNGPSMQIVDGKFTKTDKAFDGNLDAKVFEGRQPGEPMQKLGRSAGTYAVQGTMRMAPAEPLMKITGVDTFRTVYEGTVLYGRTEGTAEGMPGTYQAEVFWAWDDVRRCFLGVYLSNMGEVGAMDGRFDKGGRLISTSAGTMMGEPLVNLMVMEFDDKGAAKGTHGHTILGAAPPYESFRATYTKK